MTVSRVTACRGQFGQPSPERRTLETRAAAASCATKVARYEVMRRGAGMANRAPVQEPGIDATGHAPSFGGLPWSSGITDVRTAAFRQVSAVCQIASRLGAYDPPNPLHARINYIGVDAAQLVIIAGVKPIRVVLVSRGDQAVESFRGHVDVGVTITTAE